MIISFSLPAVSQTTTPRFHNIRFADDFPGTEPATKINAAIADCGPYSAAAGASCVVVIPPSMGCGEPTPPPDNVVLWDLRGCAQSTGFRFNLSALTAGNVRSKVYIQDNYDAQASGLGPAKSSATFYSTAFVNSANVTQGTLAAINGSMFVNRLSGDMPSGHIVGIEGEATAAIPGPSNRQIFDIRGGTFNSLVGSNVTATNVTSLYAQAPFGGSGGKILNAVSFRAEAPTSGTEKNLAGWFDGDVQVDTTTSTHTLVVGGGSPVHEIRLGSGGLSFPSIAARSCHDSAISVSGADIGSAASASPGGNIGTNLFWSAWVNAAGSVTVRVCNLGGAAVTPSAVSWKVEVMR
jgi:hypothetical protein